MKMKALLMPLVAAAALAGCDTKPEVVTGDGPYDPQAGQVANNAAVALPPSIVASHKYRCKDNSVISIDWLTNGTANSANVTVDGTMKPLKQAEAGGDYTAEGTTLTGDAQAASVTYNGQSCKK